ncbi:MAG: metallophosphoesterase [Anaerolineae bacterium]
MPETLHPGAPMVRFVQISDTHISADPHYNTDGAQHTPMIGAQALVHQINTLPFAPDFVLHTGDVAYNPDESAYGLAREILSAIRFPVYYLVGNHDDAAMMRRFMLGQDAASAPLDYEFEVNGVQVICMDSNRAAPPWMGRFSDEQMAWLDGLCRANDARPLIVALHHPVLPMGAPFWDNRMRMVDAEAIHRTLLQARDRLRGVFSGHVHQNTDIVRDGIAYFTGLSSWYQGHNYPDQQESEPDRFAEPGFSVVTVAREQIYVRRHRFIVDSGSLTS